MESIYSILTSIFNITLAGAFVVFVIKFVQFRRNLNTKNEVQSLQAKISMLRMALKGKVKKKSNSFRAKFVRPVNSGDPIDAALGQLTENKFETGDDFQNYFDLSKRINAYINAEIQALNKESHNPQNHMTQGKFEDFMGPDLKNELAIVRIIKEMSDVTARYNAKADSYNRVNPKAKIAFLDPLIFTSLTDVTRIFQDAEQPKIDSAVESNKSEAA